MISYTSWNKILLFPRIILCFRIRTFIHHVGGLRFPVLGKWTSVSTAALHRAAFVSFHWNTSLFQLDSKEAHNFRQLTALQSTNTMWYDFLALHGGRVLQRYYDDVYDFVRTFQQRHPPSPFKYGLKLWMTPKKGFKFCKNL